MKNKLIKTLTIGILTVGVFTTVPCLKADAIWRTYDNKDYYYNGSDYIKNQWFYDANRNECYFLTSDGSAAKGLTKINGDYYYFDVMSGKRIVGVITLGNKQFNTDDKGKILNTTEDELKKAEVQNIKSGYDLERYLKNHFGTVQTPYGTLSLSYDVYDSKWNSLDGSHNYSIKTDLGCITTKDGREVRISIYDLMGNITDTLNDSEKEEIRDILQDNEKAIGTTIGDNLDCHVQGGVINTGYKYKYIKEGYYSDSFATWNNDGGFHWEDKYDNIDKE